VSVPATASDDSAEPAAEEAAVTRRGLVLAAAAIAGTVLVGTSIVLVGHTGHSERTGDPLAAPQGVTAPTRHISIPTDGHTSSSPSVSPTRTATASATAEHRSAPKVTAEAAAGQAAIPASSEKRTSPPTTAADAVAQRAAAHPGRHICYRAYVSEVGWEAPVCDGGVAGATGKHRPIEAVELSTAGTSGNEANAYMAGSGWQGGGAWNWKGAANGQNLVIGNPGSGAAMRAFMTSVKSGTICANTYVSSNVGWQTTQCGSSGAKPGYLFCGSADKTTKLIEAVVFRV
jgi:hypothetical protein